MLARFLGSIRTIVALCIAVTALPAWARVRPEPCPVGRFLTPDGAHVVAHVVEPASETIVLDETSISIDPACERHAYKSRRTRRGTTMVDAYPAAVQTLPAP